MANFEKAYKRTCGNEGGYANNPNDKGGETWKGVARNYHPTWPGWAIVDQIKSQFPQTFKKELYKDQELENLVHSFYKKGFWDTAQLDRFSSQLLAENVFDASVNCGAAMGPRFLQKAINALGTSCNLVVDGIIGNMTFSALDGILATLGESKIVNAYVDIRETYHRDIVKNHPSQQVFLKGWISRCEAMRKAVA